MANRSYLYSATSDYKIIRDLSEYNYEIPIFHKILLSADTQMVESQIWNNPKKIALQGNFAKGLQKFKDFITFLKTQKDLDSTKLDKILTDTDAFFEKNPDRMLDFFLLEGGEVFDMISDMEPIIEQNEYLCSDIKSISKKIDLILETKPTDLSEYKNAYWLSDIYNNIDNLNVYWTHVVYNSFNSTK